jgi:hypothetical protein
MTVDDGSSFDSRQPIKGDPEGGVVRLSLATSLHWWTTVASLVKSILDSDEGEDPFALVIGSRTLAQLTADGTLRRTGLRTILQGGVSAVKLVRTGIGEGLPDGYIEAETLRNWNNAQMGVVGFSLGKSHTRWRFLDGNEYYLTQAGPKMAPSVVVDTSALPPWSRELDKQSHFGPRSYMIVPHTDRNEQALRLYTSWLAGGRPDIDTYKPLSNTPAWDPTTPPNPIKYTTPVVTDADFRVTGYVRDGAWQEAADLEAARSLLQTRYDLRIGIWDLVNNPTLRRTLLQSMPADLVQRSPVNVPVAAAKRAQSAVNAKMRARVEEKEGVQRAARKLKPLEVVGWRLGLDNKYWPWTLPLTPSVAVWPGDEPTPMVSLRLSIGKRSTSVSLMLRMYNQIDVRGYLNKGATLLAHIASPRACALDKKPWGDVWVEPKGWADDVDWGAIAKELCACTPKWVEAFGPMCDESMRVLVELRKQRHQIEVIRI